MKCSYCDKDATGGYEFHGPAIHVALCPQCLADYEQGMIGGDNWREHVAAVEDRRSFEEDRESARLHDPHTRVL